MDKKINVKKITVGLLTTAIVFIAIAVVWNQCSESNDLEIDYDRADYSASGMTLAQYTNGEIASSRKELKRRINMYDALDIKDGKYVLNMTVEDAVVLGLTPEGYKSFKENIEWWNLEIDEKLEKGDSIEYADLPAIRKMLRRALADKIQQDKQNSHWWNIWSGVE